MKKIVVAFVLSLAATVVLQQSCGGSGSVSGPSETPESVATVPAGSGSGGSQTLAPEPTPTPGGGPGPVSVSCNGAGVCTFSVEGNVPHKVSAVCTRIGQHNDWGSWADTINTGSTVSVYDICDPVKIGIDLCEGGEQKVQVDFTAGAGEHIGHWGLGDGLKLTYEPNKEFCECEAQWTPGEPTVEVDTEYGEWSECSAVEEDFLSSHRDKKCYGTRSRTVTKVITTTTVYTNQCNELTRKTVEVTREPQQPETEPCEIQCPAPKLCYYRVSCGEQGFVASTRECTLHKQQEICEAAEGLAGDNGIWRNFGDANLLNHCQFNAPGYSNRDFQLTPGQSDESCVNKNDETLQ